VTPRVTVVTTEASQLTLQSAVLRRTLHDGDVTRHPESHYLDFVVDGRTLSDRLPGARGMATALNRAWLPTVAGAIEELLGQRPSLGLDPGRVFLFVCGECGDLGCGAITAALRVGPNRVTWSQLAWENGSEPAEPVGNAPDVLSFDIANYEDVLAGAYKRIAALPYDQLAHQGRKFLWPWQLGWRLPKSD